MQKIVWAVCGLLAAAISVYGLWLSNVPLGVPGEWTWNRLPRDEISLGNLQLAWLCGAVYVSVVMLGGRRIQSPNIHVIEQTSWLCGLLLAAGFWIWQVQETAPTAGQWAKAPFVLYYPSSSGYFYKVRYDQVPAGRFLAEYEALMSEQDVLHVGTHPPGLFLVFYGLIGLAEQSPGITSGLTSTMPETFRDAFAIVRENTSVTAHPAVAVDETILWLATLLVFGCTIGTMLPLFGLLRANLNPEHAWYGAAFWPLIPAAAIFQPKSDAAYPFLATLFIYLGWKAWRTSSLPYALLTGFVLWCGVMCSLAFLPVVLLAALLLVIDVVLERPDYRKAGWSISFAATGFALPSVILWGLTGIIMPRIWWWNYHNHAGFYAQYPRTWWKWLLVNPLELSVAVGLPICLLAMRGLWQLQRAPRRHGAHLRWASLAGVAVWSLLWITGKNSGEAARLWLILMPFLVWLASFGLPLEAPTPAPDQRLGSWRWITFWLILQMGVAACTVHRVGGFHLVAPS